MTVTATPSFRALPQPTLMKIIVERSALWGADLGYTERSRPSIELVKERLVIRLLREGDLARNGETDYDYKRSIYTIRVTDTEDLAQILLRDEELQILVLYLTRALRKEGRGWQWATLNRAIESGMVHQVQQALPAALKNVTAGRWRVWSYGAKFQFQKDLSKKARRPVTTGNL